MNKNFYLESLDLKHAGIIFQTIDRFREELGEWLPFVEFTDGEQDIINFITRNNEKKDLSFCVMYDNQFAGLCGLKDVDMGNLKAEIGYWISPEFQNKGLATSASKALIKYAFDELALNRIQICVGTKNAKSIRVVEKLKFKFEGIERDGELLTNGFHDVNVYSLLKKEYENNQTSKPGTVE